MKQPNILLQTLIACGLIACSPVDSRFSVLDTQQPDDAAVRFAAYTVRSTRTAASDNISNVEALAKAGGFGIFAYLHEGQTLSDYVTSKTYPNLFYNQQVWESQLTDTSTYPDHRGDPHYSSTAALSWTYSPVLYYSNNQNARHSFFAYAPYDIDVNPIFSIGMAPQIQYNVAQNTDLLWAPPCIDKPKPAAGEAIQFDFQHALSRVTFHVAPFIDVVHADGNHSEGTPPANPHTIVLGDGIKVNVRNISFIGMVPNNARLNLGNGKWTMLNTDYRLEVPGSASWTGDGTTKQPYHRYAPILPIPSESLRIEIIFDVIYGSGDSPTLVTYQAQSQEQFTLEAGSAYDFYLDLGLNSVKFTATTSDWDSIGDDTSEQTILWIEDIDWIKRLDSITFE